MTDREAVLYRQLLEESARGSSAFSTGNLQPPVDRRVGKNKGERRVSNFSSGTATSLALFFERRKTNSGFAAQVNRRAQLLARDGGICQRCGLDTIALYTAVAYVARQVRLRRPGWECTFGDFRKAVGIRASRFPKSLWDGDHVQPTILGGKDVLGNWRTLCLACHKEETKRVIYA